MTVAAFLIIFAFIGCATALGIGLFLISIDEPEPADTDYDAPTPRDSRPWWVRESASQARAAERSWARGDYRDDDDPAYRCPDCGAPLDQSCDETVKHVIFPWQQEDTPMRDLKEIIHRNNPGMLTGACDPWPVGRVTNMNGDVLQPGTCPVCGESAEHLAFMERTRVTIAQEADYRQRAVETK